MKHKISNKIKTITSVIAIISSASLAVNSFATDTTSKANTKNTKTATTHKLPAAKSKDDSKAAKLIDTVTRGQAKIDESFPSIGGLTGYVISAKAAKGQQSTIVYIPHDSSYAFFGNIIDAKGNNISQTDKQVHIESKQTIKAYAEIHKIHYVTQGKDAAPHKMYIVMDPNCSYCHLIYKDLNKYVENGQLQIRWIPVGFLRPNSAGKAAAILNSKDQAEMLKNLVLDETKFNMAKEQGGIKELDKADSSKKPVVANAFKQVSENTEFFTKNNLGGTPAIFFIDKSGNPVKSPMTYVPKEAAQLQLINGASDTYDMKKHKK